MTTAAGRRQHTCGDRSIPSAQCVVGHWGYGPVTTNKSTTLSCPCRPEWEWSQQITYPEYAQGVVVLHKTPPPLLKAHTFGNMSVRQSSTAANKITPAHHTIESLQQLFVSSMDQCLPGSQRLQASGSHWQCTHPEQCTHHEGRQAVVFCNTILQNYQGCFHV